MVTPLAGRSFLATFVSVLLAIAALFVADTFLARMDRLESHTEAQRLFAEGQSLLRRGETKAAVDHINDAIAIERDNRDYLQTLAEAQLANGQSGDAEATLTEILNRDSTDGLANLEMGRTLVKEQRFSDAASYFHRAIYGHWKNDAEGQRSRVRLELIDLLAQQNAKEELLAELIPLQAEDRQPHDPKTRLRLGELFLLAGSPNRSADVFRQILHAEPANAAALRGLGQAEFAQGDYRAAQRDFQAALRISPSDTASRHQLDFCNQLLQLDPTLRGLDLQERYRRSLGLVELARNAVSQCLSADSSPELPALLAKADVALKGHPNALYAGETFEANLDLAEQLWQVRKKECQTPMPTESPLALVLARAAR